MDSSSSDGHCRATTDGRVVADATYATSTATKASPLMMMLERTIPVMVEEPQTDGKIAVSSAYCGSGQVGAV